MEGWFAIKRGTLAHEMFAPEGKWSKFEAWTWMLESAAYKPTVIDLSGTPHTVPRGALCFSLRFLADKWKWTVKAVRGFLTKLERHGAVQIQTVQVGNKKGTARTQVTLCNYEKYQGAGHSKGTAGAQQGHKEEQITNIPVGEGAEAPSEPIEYSVHSKAVWSAGKPYLTSKGVNKAGSLIGMWLKTYEHRDVLDAISMAQKAGTEDPVPYITQVLSKPSPRPTYRKGQPEKMSHVQWMKEAGRLGQQ